MNDGWIILDDDPWFVVCGRCNTKRCQSDNNNRAKHPQSETRSIDALKKHARPWDDFRVVGSPMIRALSRHVVGIESLVSTMRQSAVHSSTFGLLHAIGSQGQTTMAFYHESAI